MCKIKKRLRGESGFTILELITVIVVIGIVTGVVSVSVESVNEDTRLSNAASRALSDVRHAQEMAMTHRRPVDVIVNAGNNSYSIRWGDTGVPLINPLDNENMTVAFGSGDSKGVAMTSGLSSTLTFSATGTPSIAGASSWSSGSSGTSLMYLNNRIFVTVYPSGLTTIEKTVGGGGCAAAC
jgi:prepilin-type N-terminal cleavage/methylation domain-containing protein